MNEGPLSPALLATFSTEVQSPITYKEVWRKPVSYVLSSIYVYAVLSNENDKISGGDLLLPLLSHCLCMLYKNFSRFFLKKRFYFSMPRPWLDTGLPDQETREPIEVHQ